MTSLSSQVPFCHAAQGPKWIDHNLGLFIFFWICPVSLLLGKILGRDHNLTIEKHIVVIKMLGGGSHPYRVIEFVAGEQFFRGRVELETAGESAAVFADLIFLNKTGVEVARKVASETFAAGYNTLKFYASVPPATASVKIILRPWRAIDGKITLVGGSIDFLR